MSKSFFIAAFAFVAVSAPAHAGHTPDVRSISRSEVSARCQALGSDGKSWGLEAADGAFGCQNMVTGQAVSCAANGQCTDYIGDPRWQNIQQILKGGAGKKRQISL